jgi:iron complex outermembrane recepter protein
MAHRHTKPGARRVGGSGSFLGTGSLLGTLLIATLAQAGDLNGKVALNIPRQNLSSALTALAKQADLQILFSQELVAGLRSSAVTGSLSGAEALQRLLADSTLEYVVNGADTVVIRQRQAEAPKPVSQSQATRADDAAPAATDSPEAVGLEEIIVTAQKRSERLQDVPVAVTALSGETLTRNNVNDTAGLVAMTPSLTFTDGAQPNNRNFRIRGIGTAVFGQGLEPSVSVVMDGIPLARASQGFSDLSDIERVEVLRGPQGTLFGKNAVGGVINVVTKRPSKNFEANADATFAEDQEYRVRGSVSGPITDGLGARLTAYYNDIGGITRNITRGEDTNGQKSQGFRGKLDWDATDRLNLLFMGDYRKSEAECCSSTYLLVNNPLLTQLISPVVANWNNRVELENELTWADTEQTTFSLEANLNLDAVSFTSITAYQDFSLQNNQPIDRLNTPTPIYLPATNGYFDINGGTVDLTQLTQELRVANASGGRFNYVAGLFVLDLDLDRTFQRRSGGCAPGGNPAAFGQPCVTPLYRSQAGFLSNSGTRNYALFGQTDFNLIGNLSAVLGARAQHERISYEGNRQDVRLVAGDLPLVGTTPSQGSGHSDDSVVTGKAGLKYEFSDSAQTYLTWSTGYKGAGYETEFAADFVNQAPVKPEKAKAWELGYKARLLNGSLVLNTALFRATYEDLQVQANRGDAAIGLVRFVTTNAGSSITQGVEIELTAQPFRGFTLNGGVTYLDTSFDADGLSCALSFQAAAPVITGTAPVNTCYRTVAGATPVQNIRDGVLPNAPKWRGNLSARYEFGLPGTSYTSFAQLSSTSQSKINFVIEQDPLTVQDSYTTVDASFGFNSPDDKYRLTFFARNLFDKHYVGLLARSSTLSTQTLTPNQLTGNIPKEANRYFGATIGVSF